MIKLRHLLLVSACAIGNWAAAQTESTLYFMNSLPQVVDVNPAIMPRYKLSIGLPIISSVGETYSNNAFTFDNITSKVNGTTKVDLTKLSAKLADKNYITLSAQTDLLRVGVRLNPKMYLMVSSTVKGYNRTMIEKGLISLLVDGTGPIVGSYSNTAPQEEAISYLETAAGLAYQVNDKLTIGGRLKYYKGLTNVTTESSSLVIQVDPNYQITATGGGSFRTSGIYNLTKSGYNASDHISDYLKNSGWGLDIGGTYKFMDRLTIGASLIDIGYITWKNNDYQYTLDPSKAKYTFSGFDVNKLLSSNSAGYLNAQVDSIKNKFQMKEAGSGSYTTMLPAKMYLSANYQLIPNLSIGTLFFSEKFQGRFSSGITAALSKQFGKVVSTSFSYTASNRSYNNIGLGLSVNLAPVQLYIVGDNLLKAPASLVSSQTLDSYINNSQLLTVRAGLNLVFGWDKGTTAKQVVNDENANPSKKTKGKAKPTFGRTTKKKAPPNKKKPTSKIGR